MRKSLVVRMCLDDSGGDAPCRPQFTIEVEDICQLRLGGCVDDVGRRGTCPLVHAHVQRSVETEGEAAALVVEMMT